MYTYIHTYIHIYEITNILVDEMTIKDKLQRLNVYKSVGPDGIHPRILKEQCQDICKPLHKLFNKSITEGQLPDDWKQAKVSAIFKRKGNRKKAGNYRPVSLTCIMCKILEGCIRDHTVEHMRVNNIFSKQQFGFIKGRSTVLQLLNVMNSWTMALDNGFSIDSIYLDFMKAFDTVPHKRLIYKLRMNGINPSILRWIEGFLTGRQQQVCVNGSMSKWADVTSGIPQGSVLGPILFVIYINDLPNKIKSDIYMFADDTKVFRTIKTNNDQCIIQDDLDELTAWSTKCLLTFHPDKCKVMHLGKPLEDQFKYTLHDGTIIHDLGYTSEEKYIGVIVDTNLEFDKHLYFKVSKANSTMAVIRRSFQKLDEDTFVPLYKALVRTHLDYACCIWSPYKQTYKDAL